MKNAAWALAGLALAVAMPARADVAAATKPAAKPAPVILTQSADVLRVANWVSATNDNRALPYAIIDKHGASISVYNAKRKLIGTMPVLIGVAIGDEATPGVGSKNLAEIGPAEKTTPAGRFLAKFGRAAGKQKVLWVDYATSVALHAIPPGAKPKERRSQRMASPTPDDNRITFGCINVPTAFYGKSVAPLFQKKGGYVYILPDVKPIEDVFPMLRVEALKAGAAPG